MKTRSRRAAFTMVELLVTACISSVLGLVIYGVASEGVISFARNISINRSYSNARQTIDRISNMMQSAGHVPIIVDASGADVTTTTQVPAGIRFWRYNSAPVFCITTPGAVTDTSLTLDLTKPTTHTALPAVGDLVTVAVLGFQAQVTAVSSASSTATLTFSGTVASNTNPTLTAAALSTAATTAANTTQTPLGKMTCIVWNPVAFIAVSGQLRYYPRFNSGVTAVNTTANYKILSYLATSVAASVSPFSLGPTPSVNVDLYAEAPDYNNRTSVAGTLNAYNGVNSANTYTYIQTALAPRNPSLGLLRTPY